MIEGSGQGVLKRKLTDPKYLWGKVVEMATNNTLP